MSGGGASNGRCPYCARRGPFVQVHGHEQCAACGTNIGPCCSGADPASEAAATTGIAAGLDPRMFEQLFVHLGGPTATVTTDALLFALAQRLGSDLDEARLVLEAAERVGAVVCSPPGCCRLRRA